MEEFLYKIVTTVNSYMSDYVLIILLVGAGIFFSIKTKFVQIRGLKQAFKNSFASFSLHGDKSKDGLSSWQALATAVATQIGTGNIVGACGAILLGGPGAIFWMWVIAFFGMATIYAEAVLAQKTKVVNADGSITGGPVYYIKRAFPNKFGKFLAGFFAVSCTIALGFIGSMTLCNSISEACSSAFGIKPWIVSLIVVILTALVVLGGIKRIASTAEKIVPFMSLLYIVGGIVVIASNITVIPETIAIIFKSAFVPNAIIGGSIGYAIKMAVSQGAKRGLFSNEAGMGSTPHIHALARVDKPHDQGLVAIVGMFIDTFVVITFTALVVVSSLYTNGGNPALIEGMSKTNMAQAAFGFVFGESWGSIFVAICLVFFAFSSILGWNLYGKENVRYLLGKKAVSAYLLLSLGFIFLGGIFKNDLVWELSDFFNQLMVLPNVIALFALSNFVKKEADDGIKIDKENKKKKK